MQARVTGITKEKRWITEKLFTHLAESGQNHMMDCRKQLQWGWDAFIHLHGLLVLHYVCTAKLMASISRLDHFWLGQTNFGSQSWSTQTKFRWLNMVRPDQFLPQTEYFVTDQWYTIIQSSNQCKSDSNGFQIHSNAFGKNKGIC